MPDVISREEGKGTREEVGEEEEGVRDVVGGRFFSVEGKGAREEVGEEGEGVGEGRSGTAHLRTCETRKSLVGTPFSVCTL